MICREFAKKVEELPLSELGQASDSQLLAHQRECADCAEWLENRHVLAGALQVLRSSAAGLEAPLTVEQNVMRAFRSSAATTPAAEPKPAPQPHVLAFRLSRFFEFGAYAAAAAALAVALGLGVWYWQQHRQPGDTTSAQQNTEQKITTQPSATNRQPEKIAEVSPPPKPARAAQKVSTAARVTASEAAPAVPILAASQQAQGYTPMMLCDPLSCSGDEQVVRMELPAVNGAQDSQMADVIIGDDGLVRAIRIVQQ